MLDEPELFLPRQLLDLPFAALRLDFVRKGLIVSQLHRSAGPRVLRTLSCIVSRHTLADIRRPARIECTIGALKNIRVRLQFTQLL